MKTVGSYLTQIVVPLLLLPLAACTGTQVGLNALKAVNPTEPLAVLKPLPESADKIDGLVNELVLSYHQYGALYSATEKVRPTVENNCYELADKLKQVKPLVEEQEAVLVRTGKLYKELTALRPEDPKVKDATDTGNAYVAKARERIRKFVELSNITLSFTSDCPNAGEMFIHIMTGISAIVQYENAREKVPLFNKTAKEVEELSTEERALALEVVESLDALTPRDGGARSSADG